MIEIKSVFETVPIDSARLEGLYEPSSSTFGLLKKYNVIKASTITLAKPISIFFIMILFFFKTKVEDRFESKITLW